MGKNRVFMRFRADVHRVQAAVLLKGCVAFKCPNVRSPVRKLQRSQSSNLLSLTSAGKTNQACPKPNQSDLYPLGKLAEKTGDVQIETLGKAATEHTSVI